MKPLWKIRRIESSYEESDKACSYVVTICKNPQVSFEERNKQFYQLLHENAPEEKVRVQERMLASEMRNRYPNPGERFVESVKISKWQKKQVFDIKYGKYGGEFSFHVVPNDTYHNRNNISCLEINGTGASIILGFIHDIYPDIYERYFECNHISSQAWERIVDRIREAKDMILHDTFNSALQPYLEGISFYGFVDLDKLDSWEELRKIDNMQLAYKHRYQIADLLDAFIQWSEAQLETYAYDSGLMFNIQGP